MSLEVPHPTPERWEETYKAIKEMRAKTVAPVDTMGCDSAQLHEIDPKVDFLFLYGFIFTQILQSRRLSTLIALMLSSQTKDEVTDMAMKKLREALGGTVTLEAIIEADDNTICIAIAKVGFWRRKTQYATKYESLDIH